MTSLLGEPCHIQFPLFLSLHQLGIFIRSRIENTILLEKFVKIMKTCTVMKKDIYIYVYNVCSDVRIQILVDISAYVVLRSLTSFNVILSQALLNAFGQRLVETGVHSRLFFTSVRMKRG